MEPGIIQQNGYTWVALPKEGILPLTLLEKKEEGTFSKIKRKLFGIPESADALHADLFDLFPKSGRGAYPKVSKAQKAAFFSGHDILSNKAQLNLSSLKAMQYIGNANLEAKINKSRKRLFTFAKVELFHVMTEILLEEHLNIHKPKREAEGYIEKLQRGNIYVVTETLSTKEFSVQDVSDFELSGGINAEVIDEQLAALKAKTDHSKQVENQLGYKGEIPITFAQKAWKIIHKPEGNKYTLTKAPLASVRSGFGFEPEELGLGVIRIEE